jgi:hypothetical protein
MFNTTQAFTNLRSTNLSDRLLDSNPHNPLIPLFYCRVVKIKKHKSDSTTSYFVLSLSENNFTISQSTESEFLNYPDLQVTPPLIKLLISKLKITKFVAPATSADFD